MTYPYIWKKNRLVIWVALCILDLFICNYVYKNHPIFNHSIFFNMKASQSCWKVKNKIDLYHLLPKPSIDVAQIVHGYVIYFKFCLTFPKRSHIFSHWKVGANKLCYKCMSCRIRCKTCWYDKFAYINLNFCDK